MSCWGLLRWPRSRPRPMSNVPIAQVGVFQQGRKDDLQVGWRGMPAPKSPLGARRALNLFFRPGFGRKRVIETACVPSNPCLNTLLPLQGGLTLIRQIWMNFWGLQETGAAWFSWSPPRSHLSPGLKGMCYRPAAVFPQEMPSSTTQLGISGKTALWGEEKLQQGQTTQAELGFYSGLGAARCLAATCMGPSRALHRANATAKITPISWLG